MDEDDSKLVSHAVSLRLQRTTTEAGFISVPVTPDLMIRQPDGTVRLDVSKIVQRSVELARSTELAWHVEEQRVELHPVQMAPPESGA